MTPFNRNLDLMAECENLRTQNEQLRTALRALAGSPTCWCGRLPHTEACDLAREALKEE